MRATIRGQGAECCVVKRLAKYGRSVSINCFNSRICAACRVADIKSVGGRAIELQGGMGFL